MKQCSLTLILLLLSVITVLAQNTMRVSLKDGTCVDIPIEQIDSVNFVIVTDEQEEQLTFAVMDMGTTGSISGW